MLISLSLLWTSAFLRSTHNGCTCTTNSISTWPSRWGPTKNHREIPARNSRKVLLREETVLSIPIKSMYGIFTFIFLIYNHTWILWDSFTQISKHGLMSQVYTFYNMYCISISSQSQLAESFYSLWEVLTRNVYNWSSMLMKCHTFKQLFSLVEINIFCDAWLLFLKQ